MRRNPHSRVCVSEPKMYSIKMADEKNIKKAKSVKTCVVKKEIKHEQYKETLFGAKQLRHGMNILRSDGHEIYSMRMNKISLSPFHSKRWIDEDGIHTKAYGYKEEELEEELEEMEAALSEFLGW